MANQSATADIDKRNAEFWNELCGTSFAKHLGIRDHSEDSLQLFDRAYFDLYPYLLQHVPVHEMAGKHVLEVGLGYGTLGQKIAESGALYTGLDIAAGPVNMMNHRLRMKSLPGEAIQGSMLECPLPDASQDCVVSIGCFHHTGNVQRCFDETWRVLKPDGKAYLMVYNQFSYRQWIKWPRATLKALVSPVSAPDSNSISDAQRKAYDADGAGEGAPETVFLSIKQIRSMLSRFSETHITKENCDHITLRGRAMIPRQALLSTLGRAMGLDLYICAYK